MADTGKLSQAYIVSSPSEKAALAMAQRLAAAAVCERGGAEPCGMCRHCRKAGKNIHPDIMKISFDKDDNGKLKKSIGVDQVRELVRDACVLPNEAERKAYIISPAQSLTVQAQNSALKLLEEPPAWVTIILCTDSAGRLLPTVRSRCVEINCIGESGEGAKQTAKAEEFLSAVASGDKLSVYLWCSENEELERDAAVELIIAVQERAIAALAGEGSMGFSKERLVHIAELCARCCEYLRANVGQKHIFGLLAVDSVADGES